MANFYAGASYLKKKDFDSAIEHLKVFSSDDYLMQSRSYSLIGDAYLEQDDFEDAINYYKKACSYKPNKAFTPIYLKKLALAQELGGATQDAANTYQRIINSYPNSNAVHDAKKNKARLEVL